MAYHRVDITLQRIVTFYVDGAYRDVVEFMEANPSFEPDDVPGLIDTVSEEEPVDYLVMPEDEIEPGFKIEGGELREIE